MEVAKAIRERRSVRRFEKKDIPGDAVDGLIEALIWAPSAGNLQSRKFYFVTDSSVKKQLASAAFNQSFIADAPLVVVGCADRSIFGRYGERGTDLYCLQDVAASLMCMMLAAHETGLASVWVGAFSESDAAASLGLPSSLRPVAIVPVGYPGKIPPAPRRVSKEEAVEFV